jgi:hypothetical protein
MFGATRRSTTLYVSTMCSLHPLQPCPVRVRVRVRVSVSVTVRVTVTEHPIGSRL